MIKADEKPFFFVRKIIEKNRHCAAIKNGTVKATENRFIENSRKKIGPARQQKMECRKRTQNLFFPKILEKHSALRGNPNWNGKSE